MASAPPASVLIVGYHAYDELHECLTSLAIHEPDVQVIVVDHDADPVRGATLRAAHPTIVYDPCQSNPGFGAGVNRAARRATSPALLVLNPDAVLSGPVVAPMARHLTSRPDVAIVGGLIREPDGSIQQSARRFPDLTTALGGRTSWLTRVSPGNVFTQRNLRATGALDAPMDVDWVTGAFMMVRADAFRSLGGFDERFFMYWEDSDLCLRARQAGWKTVFEPAAAIVHLTGRSSRHVRVRSLVAFHRSAFRHYWKHGSTAGRVFAPLVAVGLALRLLVRLAGSVRT